MSAGGIDCTGVWVISTFQEMTASLRNHIEDFEALEGTRFLALQLTSFQACKSMTSGILPRDHGGKVLAGYTGQSGDRVENSGCGNDGL